MLDLRIAKQENFDSNNEQTHIITLLSMMNFTRSGTINVVRNLSMRQLDWYHDDKSNSIGSLLMHIGCLELICQLELFESRYLSSKEMKKWGIALPDELPKRLVEGYNIDYYLSNLADIREQTLRYLKIKPDLWLSNSKIDGSVIYDNYFKLFHIMEDEIAHRGQIVWLKKRLPF